MRTQTTSNETVEMYLKTIAELSDGQSPVVIARVAERLGVTPVSANEMMKRLVEQGLVTHKRYKGVSLTTAGRQIAHSVMRRQRLWECFLVDHVKLNWSGAYEAACRLEHATSNVVAEALAAFLGHPTVCPHGNPIPDCAGAIPPITACSLASLPSGTQGHIHSIQPTTTDVFSYFERHHIAPGARFAITEVAPLDGPITLTLAASRVSLGRALADLVWVDVKE